MEDPFPETLLSRSNSPEFEFRVLRDPSFPQPDLLSADELFSGGVLVPLRLLNEKRIDPDGLFNPPEPSTSVPPEPEISATGSKRWKDLFKKKSVAGAEQGKDREKQRKRGKKSQLGPSSAAELNIHLWPFARSRSDGNGGVRAKSAAGSGGRKVSSAPCSRSNSAGESKSRKWPNSPGRIGVHLGRSSPVWQVRRTASGRRNPVPEPRRSEAAAGGSDGGGGAKGRGLNLNVPTCIGYRNHFSCRSSENSAAGGVVTDGGNSGGGTIFNIRNLFAKKVY